MAALPKRVETRACKRLIDGVILPFSPQLDNRRDFVTIDQKTQLPVDGSGAPLPAPVLDFTAVNQTVAEYYAGFDEIQLTAALIEQHGLTPPPTATREQLIGFLAMFPLPTPTQADQNVTGPTPDPNASLPTPPDAGNPNGPSLEGLAALSKEELTKKALADFGFEMPQALTKQQMIDQFAFLKPKA